jgi:hypothetical protein
LDALCARPALKWMACVVDSHVLWRLTVEFESRDMADAEWLEGMTGLSDRTQGLHPVSASDAPSTAQWLFELCPICASDAPSTAQWLFES